MQHSNITPLLSLTLDKDNMHHLNNDSNDDSSLPQALEKMLAFKHTRATELGIKSSELSDREASGLASADSKPDYRNNSGSDSDNISKPKEKSRRRKKKKKKNKPHKTMVTKILNSENETDNKSDDEVEYIQEKIAMDKFDPTYNEFRKIFKVFEIVDKDFIDLIPSADPTKTAATKKMAAQKDPMRDDDSDDNEMPDPDEVAKMSKKKQKKLSRLSVAELKQLVARPDVVEMHDVTAHDPKLLVHLKSTRNTVPVPRHWCFKRKYLQGKRGFEKPAFDLPHYIKSTGIMEMREALQDKEDAKAMKSKMREKIRPKMGKIDIDYQKLHDAFFKYQTKPTMSIHGELYYEGKEFETKLKEKKPGNLSHDLRTALGMPVNDHLEKFPPPWLIAMQRYGPPPSYPNLKIPGLNSPIPENCTFGYHIGGWGKPPVDETGKPLYGDVFGTQASDFQSGLLDEDPIDINLWGALESESDEEDSSAEEDADADDGTGLVTPMADGGLVTPSGMQSSVTSVGIETPDMIELRKKRIIEDSMESGIDSEQPVLYQVLQEKKAAIGANTMMGSSHVYDISAPKRGDDGVEVTLNPEELDLDTSALQAKYDQTLRDQKKDSNKEDLSDMVAEYQAKQKNKRKKPANEKTKDVKKYKFKF